MTARRNRRWPDLGATVTEAMVVVLVVGTLLVIAVPTFTGSRGHSQDAAAQRALRTSLTSADVIFTDRQSFADATPDALTKVTPTLTYVEERIISTAPTYVSVAHDKERWSGAVQSESGTCFLISARANGRVRYGTSIHGLCNGALARDGATADSW